MSKEKEFNNILDACLDRVLDKGETIEQCLASYPGQAAELEPLLQTALAAGEALAIRPRPEFRERARYQFQAALREMEQKREQRFSFFSRQPRWATAVIAVLVVLLAGGGTVAAAGNSMPDGLLYSVKLATETVRLALTPSELGKAELYTGLADKRVTEIVYLADKGKAGQVDEVADRLETQLAMVADLMAPEEAAMLMAPAPRAVLQGAPVMPVPEAAVEEAPVPAPAPVMMVPEAAVEEAPAVPVPQPAPQVALAPPEPAVDAMGRGVGGEEGVEVDSEAELSMILARYAVDNQEALRAALERAPESVKPALLRALAIAEAGYDKAIGALD